MKVQYNFFLYICAFASIILTACSNSSQDTSQTIAINPTQSPVHSVSEMAHTIEYVPLSLPIIGEIGSRIIHSQNLFFVPTNYPACIHIFDEAGNSASNICQQGEGPGKYKSISDFIVAPSGDALYILSRNSFKIMKYDLDGNFIEDYKIPVYASKFEIWDDERFVLYCGNEKTEYNATKIVFYNYQTGETEEGPFPINAKESRYLNFFDRNNFLKTEDDELYFFYGFNDTIYRLAHQEAVPHRVINFGKHTIPPEFYAQEFQDVMDFMSRVRNPANDFAARIIGYYETDTHIHFIFEFRQKFLMVFYDKNSETYTLSSEMEDDMVLEGFSVYEGVEDGPRGVTEDGQFIFMKEAGYIRAHLDSLKQTSSVKAWNTISERHAIIKSLDERLDINSNPVLILVEPRPF